MSPRYLPRPIDRAVDLFAVGFGVLVVLVAWSEDPTLAGVFCLGVGAVTLLLGGWGLRASRRGAPLADLDEVFGPTRSHASAFNQAQLYPKLTIVAGIGCLVIAAIAFVSA